MPSGTPAITTPTPPAPAAAPASAPASSAATPVSRPAPASGGAPGAPRVSPFGAPGVGLGPRPQAAQPAPAAAKPAAAATPAAAPAGSAGGGEDLNEQRIRQIYSKYVETKRSTNESTAGVTYDKLAESLRAQARKLKSVHPAKTVDYEVVVKDGKTQLKPVLR